MLERIASMFQKREIMNVIGQPINSVKRSDFSNVHSVDALKKQIYDLLFKMCVPQDLIDRLVCKDFNPLDLHKHQDLLLSCYGRLEHLQLLGSCEALLLQELLSSDGIVVGEGESVVTEALVSDGAIKTDDAFDVNKVNEISEWFRSRPCFNGHMPSTALDAVGRYVDKGAEAFPFGSYSVDDIVSAPYLLEYVLSEEVLLAASRHLGCVPTLCNLQAWWNFAEHSTNDVPGGFAPRFYHRDLNDLRMFWVYIYLTDVNQDSGPHMVIRGSSDVDVIYNSIIRAKKHFPEIMSSLSDLTVRDFFYQYGYQIPAEVMNQIFYDLETQFCGPAGTGFYSNGFNFHRIKYPLRQNRLLFSARFSINSEPSGNASDLISPDAITSRVGDSPALRYITRNFVSY